MSGDPEQVIRDAARWDARLRSPECTNAERRRFAAWRATEPRADDHLALLAHAATLLRPPAATARVRSRPHAAGRWWAAGAAVAAAAAAAVLVVGPGWRGRDSGTIAAATTTARTVRLADGSVVALAPHSAIRIDLRRRERRAMLVSGSARFRIGEDAARPFVLRVGDRRITAGATQFAAAVGRDRVRITQMEGQVRVWCWHGLMPSEVLLRPGQRMEAEIGSDRVRFTRMS